MVYMGLESGADEVLKFVKKGVTSEEMIEAAKQKGINLLRTEMPIYELCVAVSRVLS